MTDLNTRPSSDYIILSDALRADLAAARRERDAWREVAGRLALAAAHVCNELTDRTCTCGGINVGAGEMHELNCWEPNRVELLATLQPEIAAYNALAKGDGR